MASPMPVSQNAAWLCVLIRHDVGNHDGPDRLQRSARPAFARRLLGGFAALQMVIPDLERGLVDGRPFGLLGVMRRDPFDLWPVRS